MSGRPTIIIVGAGPTGLSAAILLRQRGLDPIVLDRRPSLAGLPAAHVVNTRSMEVCAEIGIADTLLARGDPHAMSSMIVWVESLAGREYGRLPIQGAVVDPRGPLSAFRSLNIAQTELERVLYERLCALGGAVHFGEEVSGVELNERQADVLIRSANESTARRLSCDWLLGCDGAASVVRRSAGIAMNGPRTIARFMTIYFHADLDRFRTGRRGLLYWIGGPDARGVFICFDRPGRTWAMLVPIGDLPPETFGADAAQAIVHKAIGSRDVAVTLLGLSSWNMSAQVAGAFRRGPVLLAGDACHRFPPTGGLGMNTGIQDAHNLAWKLAAVIEGRAPVRLLDSYELERRPIAQRNTEQSVHNLMKMGMIDAALGVQTLAPIAADAGEGPIRAFPPDVLRIDGNGRAAVTRRAHIQAAIDQQSEHFAQGAGLDLGFSYVAGAFVPDGSPPPSSASTEYRPDAHPGARLPYVSINGPHFARSTLGLVRSAGLTLFTGDRRWEGDAEHAAAQNGVPIYAISIDEVFAARAGLVRDVLGISADGAVLVRPDAHVVWRAIRRDQAHLESFFTAVRESHALHPQPLPQET